VYVSYDAGASWAPMGQGLPRVQVHQLEVNPTLGILAAATYGRGMWELALSSPSPAPRRVGRPLLGQDAAALLTAILFSAPAVLYPEPIHATSPVTARPGERIGTLALMATDQVPRASDAQLSGSRHGDPLPVADLEGQTGLTW
jgi:hypothetical protein